MNAPATLTKLRIDFVSDVVCPWCAIGLASLETALGRVGDGIEADLHFQPFELNPQMAAEGEDITEHLSRKYGIDAAQIERNREAIRLRGAEVGFRFGPRSRIVNTFDAHRLLHWAGLEGRQHELKRALLAAYHGEGQDPSDPDVLAASAAQAGLDAARAREVLASGRYADEVRANERHWLELGVNSVPAVIVNQRHLISGGQPPEVFEQALRQIAAQG
ncbi:MAG TPA: DsbA family oxidoreductase [Burkholderiaceae bacterium]|jgi:predicted DsbA family dithiol-disulfide isomerase|nr:DsbA family oxidoreductase [Burkholderiaceae bacterium]